VAWGALRFRGNCRCLVPKATNDVLALASARALTLLDFVTSRGHCLEMKAVGIKQFKAHLSEYVRLAKSGEIVLVTEREEVVAELRPARRQAPLTTETDDVLAELAEAGDVERAGATKSRWSWKVKGLGLPKGTAAKILDALRKDS
jgi:antitoxin (DNA-binding transcriptional repressor) of toxin-antitoxin stability system